MLENEGSRMNSTPRVIEHKGCALHFWVKGPVGIPGQGQGAIFIQGVGVHGAGWKPQVDALSSHHACLVFDNRGMGLSQPVGTPLSIEQMAEDTHQIMQAQGWSQAHLVGHSMGGLIAQEFALKYPKAVKSLALLCTLAEGSRVAPLSWRFLKLAIGTALGTRAMRRRAFVRLILPPGHATRRELDTLAAELEPLFGHDLGIQPPIVSAQLRALRSHSTLDRLKKLGSLPTLVVSARYDPIAPPQLGEQIAAAIPHARWVVLENGSHGAPLADPSSINQLLSDHWKHAEGLQGNLR